VVKPNVKKEAAEVVDGDGNPVLQRYSSGQMDVEDSDTAEHQSNDAGVESGPPGTRLQQNGEGTDNVTARWAFQSGANYK